MDLIQRAKNITLSPKTEWEVIAAESATVAGLFKTYVIPLSAIGVIALFIGSSLIGFSVPILGSYRVPLMDGLTHAIVAYILGLAGVFVLGLIIDALAPTFGGEKNQIQALKVVTFSSIPVWIASVVNIIPALGLLILIAALYSLYVLFLGLPVLMKAPKEKAVAYTAVVIASAIGLAIVVGVIGQVTGVGFGGPAMRMSRSGSPSVANNEVVTQLEQYGKQMEAAGKKMEAAQKSGDQQAQMAAATAALGAAMGADGKIEVVDQALLKAMLPESLPGLKRSAISAEKTAMAGFGISKALAAYTDDQGRSIDLSITDIGGNKMFGAIAAWGLVEMQKETDSGYEKMGKVDGRPSHEKFNKNGPSGDYGVLVAGRFLVETRGHKTEMQALKEAVAAIDLGKLEGMKNAGVKQ
ncbi:hypothetical protein BH11PSE11_BH11PSE11_33430 [soil metagenome]